MDKILVIQTASIGDVVLATSLVESIHKAFPQARIDILVKKPLEGLFNSHPYIGRIIVWDKSQHKYKNLLSTIFLIRSFNYDYVFNLQRFFSSGLITSFSKAKHRIGFKKNPMSIFFTKRVEHRIGEKEFVHEIDRNYSLIKDYIKDKGLEKPRLYPTIDNEAKISEYKRGIYYTVSPSSLWQTKTYHKEGWIELLNKVEKDRAIYLLGSKSDISLCEEIKSKVDNPNILNLAGKLSFLDTCSLMKYAKMNFSNDSAPLHFASSVNAPITAIFCSTIEGFGFTPLSDDSLVVKSSMELDCKPCGIHGQSSCPKGHFLCAKSIDIEVLVSRL
ncbi:MAG: glycosyltransferase family 9 protein [Bacteroidales bacterium]